MEAAPPAIRFEAVTKAYGGIPAVEAVTLSMTKFCGVSAMVAPTSPIFYSVVVNGEIEGRDQAHFPTP